MPVAQLALFFWMVVTPLFQWNLYPVRNSGIYLSVALLLVVLLLAAGRLVRHPKLWPARSRLTVPLCALAITAVAAGVQGAIFYDRSVPGQHRYLAVQIYAVGLFGLSIVSAFAVSFIINTIEDVRRFRWVLIGTTALLLLRLVLQMTVYRSSLATAVTWWPLITAHGVAMAMASLLFERHSGPRFYFLGLMLIGTDLALIVLIPFLSTVSTQWLSGWISLGVPLALLVLARFPTLTMKIGIPAALLFLAWQFEDVLRVYRVAAAEGDFLRLRLWEDAVELTYQRPLLGIGPGNYLDYVMRYGQLGVMLSSPHGNYQQIAAETGLLGIGFALWVFGRALGLGWRLYQRMADPIARAVSIAITTSLAGQLCAAFVGDFVLPNYHNGGAFTIGSTIFAWLLIGVLMSLERIDASVRTSTQAQDGDQRHESRSDPLEG